MQKSTSFNQTTFTIKAKVSPKNLKSFISKKSWKVRSNWKRSTTPQKQVQSGRSRENRRSVKTSTVLSQGERLRVIIDSPWAKLDGPESKWTIICMKVVGPCQFKFELWEYYLHRKFRKTLFIVNRVDLSLLVLISCYNESLNLTITTRNQLRNQFQTHYWLLDILRICRLVQLYPDF